MNGSHPFSCWQMFFCRKKSWTCCTMCFGWLCPAGQWTSPRLYLVQVGHT